MVLDDFYMPNSPFVREIVSEALIKRGAILEDRIQFSHVGGLEWLANLLRHPGTSISNVFEAKTATPEYMERDFKNFVPNYATQTLEDVEIDPWMPLFDDIYDEFKQGVVSRMQKNHDSQ